MAVHEGYIEDDALTEVVAIGTKHIKVLRYPGVKFDRQTGRQIPRDRGGRTYRYLFSPAEWQAQANNESYQQRLSDLLRNFTIDSEKFRKCHIALERILSE